MKNKILTILSIIAFVGGFFALYFNGPTEQKTFIATQARQTNTKQNWEPKIDNQSAVTVTVTPIDISSQSKEWKFDIVMNTHSVELDQDMIKSAVLINDEGKEYKPIGWEGSVGGHHREGTLIFGQITPTPKFIELKILEIGNVVRSFIWQLR